MTPLNPGTDGRGHLRRVKWGVRDRKTMGKSDQVRPLRALQGQLRPCECEVAIPAESGDWPIAQQALNNEKPG
jgi:hypothetical protein